MVRLADAATGLPAAGIIPDGKRQITLKEIMGMGGPLEVLVNNSRFSAASTENPRVGSTEVWEIINLTADAHPIHLHLVQFQLLNRQPFNLTAYNKAYDAAFPGGVSPVDGMTYGAGVFIPGFGPPLPYDAPNAAGALGGNPDITPYLQGAATLPLPQENGWKDTFVMYPGEVTRVIVRWAPQNLAVGAVAAGQITFSFDPTAGPGYVWHCHIIDHEDNEMMRPYMVLP
jgi:FtsP/CotA-like multicopper oxidase with cupredoxin domain